ncbi:response regulator [Dactylosporangium cerinum]|uniref:Response regulator n=1 Tax=Dactylosporangium cerinum TaxID=1434730 RepID=A0ABV9WNV6_9ACTN
MQDEEAPVARVLVAEDDSDIRDLFTMILESAGAAVVAVNSGGAALEALRSQQFDLLVTDMWMPQVSGLDLCKAVRADPATAGLPILMLSAYGRMGGPAEAMMAGATEYHTKPIRPGVLVGKADALLGGRLTAPSRDARRATG